MTGSSWPYDVLVREFGERLDDLAALLGGRPFFYAERPSAADLAIYVQLATLRSAPTPELEVGLAERPALSDHAKHVEERRW